MRSFFEIEGDGVFRHTLESFPPVVSENPFSS